MIWLLLFPLGCFAGFIAGLFGVGGGIILVPIFLEIFTQMGLGDASIKMALGTSHMVIAATSLMAIRTHARYAKVDWNTVSQLALGALGGAAVGGFGATLLPASLLRYLFAGFVLFLAFRMGVQKEDRPKADTVAQRPTDGPPRLAVGFGIGGFAAFFGVGGGLIAVPYLINRAKKPVHEAMSTSSGLILCVALVSASVFAFSGLGRAPEASLAMGYVHLGVATLGGAGAMLGARLGVHTARRVSSEKLLGAFSLFLIVVAVRLLTRG